MDELGALFLRTAYSIPDAHAKALASYIFRQVIEDVHVKYSISQQDMMAMNKAALNRASLFVNKIKDDPKLYAAFAFVCVRLVIGAMITVGLCLLPVLLEITSTGLVPPCSEPITGLSSA